MIDKLRRMYREITRAPAGERFYRYHRLRKGRAGPWHTVVYGGAGALLVISGFLLSLPPLLPGFLLWLPGLALIASQSGSVARALDAGERLVRRLTGHRRAQ